MCLEGSLKGMAILFGCRELSSSEISGFQGGSVVKNLPAKQEMWIWFLGQEDALEKEMATHSSILAWEIPWTEEPGGLQSMGSQKSQIHWLKNNNLSINRTNLCESPSEDPQQSVMSAQELLLLSRFSHVWLCATPWTVGHQAPLSMGFSRQGYWSGVPSPPPGDLPDPGIEPASPVAPAL